MRLLLQLVIGVCLTQKAFGYFPGSTEEPDTHLEKRAYPMLTQFLPQPWPDAKITYCFDTPEAKKQLRSLIPQAFKKWLNAGLNPAFKMVEGKADYCTLANSGSYLTIKYNNEGKLTTTRGQVSHSGHSSTCLLDPSPSVGMGDTTGNIAHELGHAWGLGHEHQRPSLWTTAFGGDATTATLTFTCENLKDYAQFEAIQAQKGETMDDICHSANAANAVGFSALDIIADRFGNEKPGDPVDWESIMIYGSTAGGKKDANGQRANTMLKADGSTFGYNSKPSATDIEALHKLYQNELPDPSTKSSRPIWKGGKFTSMFKSKNKDDSCSI